MTRVQLLTRLGMFETAGEWELGMTWSLQPTGYPRLRIKMVAVRPIELRVTVDPSPAWGVVPDVDITPSWGVHYPINGIPDCSVCVVDE